MIEVRNLVKRYGDHLAVDHLSFTVEKGQIYGFLGPNGAGKSTTMNMMTGYIAATEGEVFINGHNILEEPKEAKRCIGYLPEQPPIYPEMKVIEYLDFAADLKGISKDKKEEMIEEAIEITKLSDVEGRLIKNLSKGYKQRVGLAQAILGYPEVIILDEPTVGLDPKQITQIRDLIKELAVNHTVILSSHILSEISAVCDHIMIIAQGKLVASDTPENLKKLMKGSRSIELTVKGSKEEVNHVLDQIPQIQEVNFHESEEEDISISIKTSEDVDIREELFYAFAKAQNPILAMNLSTMSLEDVFLELTQGTKTQTKEKQNLFDKILQRGKKKVDDIKEDEEDKEQNYMENTSSIEDKVDRGNEDHDSTL
ncbi:MAG TPA: ABC transporter ATP-binding protein [Candidatus Merdenecus merdavium]|nr:ABC transporter ATP-binding protein [Candidatus Merdenecus merdavium]